MFSWIIADRTKYKANILALISPFIQQPKKKALFWEEANYKFKIWTAEKEPNQEETKADHGSGTDSKGPGKDWPRGKEAFQERGGQTHLPYLLSQDHPEARA